MRIPTVCTICFIAVLIEAETENHIVNNAHLCTKLSQLTHNSKRQDSAQETPTAADIVTYNQCTVNDCIDVIALYSRRFVNFSVRWSIVLLL